MKSAHSTRALALTALALFAGSASAHSDVSAINSFTLGLAHPLLGLDHLLAMVAVGLWAAQQGGRALWAVPAAFVGAMVAGGGLAWSGIALPQVESAIALSVLALGLLVATRRRWSVTSGMAVAAAFALFHGYAHGLEMPQAAAPAAAGLGFVLTTLLLHGAGVAAGLAGRGRTRAAGLGIAASGAALLLLG